MRWTLPLGVAALAVLAEVTLGRASGAPDFVLFLGRFHPLVVHLPIGFFILVAMAEAASFFPKLRDRVEPAIGLLVPVSAVAALGAFLMGQMLALEGGFPAGSLGWHRRLTLLAVMGISLSWVLYERARATSGPSAGNARWAYRGAVGLALGLLSLGAHFGGTMTRGESYLSKYAPGPLKPLLGTPEKKKEPAPSASDKSAAPPPADPLVYKDVIAPVLKRYCVDCHGPDKQKGKLRLDSLEELQKGGENGAALAPGDAKKGTLLARLRLPKSDDDHMPPEGKPGPSDDQIQLIQFWIERGATPTLKVRDALAPTGARSVLEHALGEAPKKDEVPVAAAQGSDVAKPSDAKPSDAKPSDGAAKPNDAAPSAVAPGADSGAKTSSISNSFAGSEKASGSGNGSGSESKSAGKTSAGAAAPTPDAGAPPASAAEAPAAPTHGVSSGPAFLSTYCEKCHGAQKQKAKLRVDSVAALLQGGQGGPALVQGSPEQSLIVKRVKLPLAADEHMPPAKSDQPSASEVAALVAWVRANHGGAAASGGAVASKPTSGAKPASGSSSAPVSAVANGAEEPSSGSENGAAPASASSGAGSGAATASSATTTTSGNAAELASADQLKSLPPQIALFHDGVQPLLREKCGKCHIREKPAGGLNVDQQASLLEGGFSGAGIVPKNRKDSVIMQRLVLPPSDDEHMPPEGEPVLSADEVELVGAWIDAGAPAGGSTETAKLTAGAARALSARGVKGSASEAQAALPPQAGGCGACSVPGAPQSKWLGLQALTLAGVAAVLAARRRTRPA